MARVEIPEVIWQSTTIAGSSALAPKPGASVQVNLRSGGAATVMDAESGGSPLSNPLTSDSLGRVFGWLEEGSYDLIVDGDAGNPFRLEAVRGTRTDIILGSDVSLSRVAANVLGLGANDQMAIPGQSVNALPGSPQDGQIVAYRADATGGVIWLFQYRSASASASKWEFIGGPPLMTEVLAQESTTSTAYTDLATVGPSVTAPLPGDYVIEHGSTVFLSAGTGVCSSQHSYAIGASAASDNDGLQHNDTPQSRVYAMAASHKKTGLAASTAIVSKYKVTGTTPTANFLRRFIKLTPIRVGP